MLAAKRRSDIAGLMSVARAPMGQSATACRKLPAPLLSVRMNNYRLYYMKTDAAPRRRSASAPTLLFPPEIKSLS